MDGRFLVNYAQIPSGRRNAMNMVFRLSGILALGLILEAGAGARRPE